MKSEMLRGGKKRDYRRYVTKWTDSLVARRKKKSLKEGNPRVSSIGFDPNSKPCSLNDFQASRLFHVSTWLRGNVFEVVVWIELLLRGGG